MIARREGIKNNKQGEIELYNRTGIFCALHTAPQWNFFFSFFIEEREKSNLSDPDR